MPAEYQWHIDLWNGHRHIHAAILRGQQRAARERSALLIRLGNALSRRATQSRLTGMSMEQLSAALDTLTAARHA